MDKLRSLNVFQEIDFRFAEFICRKEQASEQEDILFNAVLCLSHFANRQHSVLPLRESNIEYTLENSEETLEFPLQFDDFDQWFTLFPNTMGSGDEDKPLILDLKNGLLYLNKYYRAEQSVIQFIRSMNDHINQLNPELADDLNRLFPSKKVLGNRNQESGVSEHDNVEEAGRRNQEEGHNNLKPEALNLKPEDLNLKPTTQNPDAIVAPPGEVQPGQNPDKKPSCPYGSTDWQKVAAFTALRSHFCVISGGPGTGKTTTVAKILALLLRQDPETRIDLVAPTGKAADRLGESILGAIDYMASEGLVDQATLDKMPRTAQTIHRFLGYHPQAGFRVNSRNLANSNILLIDESSMVALPMFRSILSALRPDCRVILLGDKDQLAAVETGNVLGDLSSGENINLFSSDFCADYSEITGASFDFVNPQSSPLNDIMLKLEFSYRFDQNSGIGQLASLVNKADETTLPNEFAQVFESFPDISLNELPKKIEDILRDNLPIAAFFKFYKPIIKTADPLQVLEVLKQFRILCASRTRAYGSEAINELISRHFFNSSDQALYSGRCIMITRNDYSLGLFNGDIGVIMLGKDKIPMACFPGPDNSIREFPPSLLPDYETSFAMTIHKSQGSEYNNIFLILNNKQQNLLSKELIYTGITRAREHVQIYSSLEGLCTASQNKTQRFSGLKLHLES